MIETVTLRNPLVIEAIVRETREGAGRHPTETADNLILEAAGRREMQRHGDAVREEGRGEDDGAPPPPKEAKSSKITQVSAAQA